MDSLCCCKKEKYLDVDDVYPGDIPLQAPNEEGPTNAQIFGRSLQWVGASFFYLGSGALVAGFKFDFQGPKFNETAGGYDVPDMLEMAGGAAMFLGGNLFMAGTGVIGCSAKNNDAYLNERSWLSFRKNY